METFDETSACDPSEVRSNLAYFIRILTLRFLSKWIEIGVTGLSSQSWRKINDSDTGNRTPSYRVKGDNVSRYTISDGVDFVIKR